MNGPIRSSIARLTRAGLAAILLAALPAQAAQYRFTVEPTYSAAAAQDIYKPLLDYLGKATGESFVLIAPTSYSNYWRDILNPDQTDFVWDEAQFAAYRIKHLGFIPLVRRADATQYALVASPDFEGKQPRALLGSRVTTMPAPSLGYALLMQIFSDPVQQPDIQSNAGSWREALEILNSGEVEAAIAPTWVLQTFGNPSLVTLSTSREFTGSAILAAPNVPEEVRNKVREALLNVDGAPELGDLLLELGFSKLVPATAKEYEGADVMLSGFYGYRK